MTTDSNGNGDSSNGEYQASFDIPNLKKGTMQLILRTHKKIGNVSSWMRSAKEQYDKVRVAMDTRSSSEDTTLSMTHYCNKWN
jgi:hypothetical protein